MIESEEFCCLYRTRLGSNSLVFGAEMDAIEISDRVRNVESIDAIDLNREVFVEMKTSRQIDHQGQQRNFCKFKLIKVKK